MLLLIYSLFFFIIWVGSLYVCSLIENCKIKSVFFFFFVGFLLTSKLSSLPLQAIILHQKGNLMELVDPELGSEFSKEEALRMIKVALLCINPSPAPRPTMSAVVSMLEGQTVVDELNMDLRIYSNEWTFERDQFGQSQRESSMESQSLTQSLKARWIGSSSTSHQDLYPTNLDSQ